MSLPYKNFGEQFNMKISVTIEKWRILKENIQSAAK
jgi:hypothetical protein